MIGFSNGSTRDLREGVVSFDKWEFGDEHQKIDAKHFQAGIENALADEPPTLTVDTNKNADDVILEFSVSALGDGDDIGPAWRFSLKDALTGFECSKDDANDLLRALQAMVEHVKAEIEQMPVAGFNARRALRGEPRLIGLDGEDVPKSITRRLLEDMTPGIVKRMIDALQNDKPLE